MVNPVDIECSTATETVTATATPTPTLTETSTITVVGAATTVAADLNDCSKPIIGLAVGLGVPLAIALFALAITTKCVQKTLNLCHNIGGGTSPSGGGTAPSGGGIAPGGGGTALVELAIWGSSNKETGHSHFNRTSHGSFLPTNERSSL
jgi:uncharacterized membrane protein YgcG